VVVRINDRGPFHSDRLIDLSYTAAYKLGVLGGGKALVEVEAIIPAAGTPAVAAAAPAPSPPVATVTPVPPPAPPVAVPLPAERAAPAPPVEPVVTQPAGQDGIAATPVVAVTADQKGLYLQLGAFGSQDNAENYLARLRTQVDWLAPALHVYPKDGLFRVHAGPYANQSDARAAADRIVQALGIKALVLVR
jgi:rare lipoprotein A